MTIMSVRDANKLARYTSKHIIGCYEGEQGTTQGRMTSLRTHKGIVEGKQINTGKWYPLISWRIM